ncbi:MAG: ABC transporter ATP-binding protein [Bacilli bacterium]|nr:ABC transporter ATP-binding protein [Bacilli bacterium]
MIKKLAKSIREYKKETILTPIFMILEVIMETLIPFLLAKLIDDGVKMGNMGVITRFGIYLVISALFSLTFSIIAGILASKASCGFAKNLRHDMYYKIQDYSFYNIDKFSASSLVTRLTTDVGNVQMAYMMMIRMAFRAPFTVLFSLIMAFNLNKKISLIFLVIMPILACILLLIAKKAHKYFDKVFKTYDKLNNVVSENVRGMRVVKSYVTENKEISKFKKVSNEIYNYFMKAEKLVAFNSPVMQLVMYSCILFISYFSARYIVSGNMQTGELMSLITYALQILMNLMMLSMMFVMLTIAGTSSKRIVELLDEVPDLDNPENAIRNVKDGSIEFKNVDFSYVKDKNKLCLKNINLSIKSGEVVGILGGTGSGKSTLVQLIPRLYDATNGKVMVSNVDVRDYDINALRDEVAMVLQKNILFSGTIKENLRWGCEEATDEELIRVCKLAQAHDFIMSFPDKYDTYIEQGGTNVSGGQKQRLCIARALLKKPKILILDDSTSAVDTKTDKLIRKAFKSEIPNTTKIIIAQRVNSIMDADKIIVMDNGKINGIGTHKELLKNNEIYRDVYLSQTKGGVIDE